MPAGKYAILIEQGATLKLDLAYEKAQKQINKMRKRNKKTL